MTATASVARHAVAAGLIAVSVLAISAISPFDRFTWWLEVTPVVLGVPALAATYPRFPLTPLVYWALCLHMVILAVGGHYTYAEVPLGFWLQEWFGFARNHYDRIGHFAQGFIPALLTREIIMRNLPTIPRGWVFLFVASICLGFSACYEFVEWWTALLSGAAADAFLGTQGDPWDTQWDMFLALVGAVSAQVLLGRWHDAHLRRYVVAAPRATR